MNTYDAILARRSVRKFYDQPISLAVMSKLLLAGNCAPIGRGQSQSMFLSVVQTPKLLEEIKQEARKKFNLPDALYGAPALVVVSSCGDSMFENIEYANAACIIENIMLAATDLELGSVYIWGAVTAFRDNAEICAELNLPEGFRPVSAVALGYTSAPVEEREPRVKIPCRFV